MDFFATENDIYLFMQRYDSNKMDKYTVEELKRIVKDLATAYGKIDGGQTKFEEFGKTTTRKEPIIEEIDEKVGDTTSLKIMLKICMGTATESNELEAKKKDLRSKGFLDTGTSREISSRWTNFFRHGRYYFEDMNEDSLRKKCKKLGLTSSGDRILLLRRIRNHKIDQFDERHRKKRNRNKRHRNRRHTPTSDDNLAGAVGLGVIVGSIGSAIFGSRNNTKKTTLRF